MSSSTRVVCPDCGAVNRVPSGRLGAGPKCGRCHANIFSAQPMVLTAKSFQRQISNSDVPILVDFWAPWCGPCKMMAPAFERASAALEPRVKLAKLNTENEQAVAAQFHIRSIPTLVLFSGGSEVARHSGAMTAEQIEQWASQQIARTV